MSAPFIVRNLGDRSAAIVSRETGEPVGDVEWSGWVSTNAWDGYVGVGDQRRKLPHYWTTRREAARAVWEAAVG